MDGNMQDDCEVNGRITFHLSVSSSLVTMESATGGEKDASSTSGMDRRCKPQPCGSSMTGCGQVSVKCSILNPSFCIGIYHSGTPVDRYVDAVDTAEGKFC
jgi:hypothetical protein